MQNLHSIQHLCRLTTRELKLEYIFAMATSRHDDAKAILAEIERREMAGKVVFTPVREG